MKKTRFRYAWVICLAAALSLVGAAELEAQGVLFVKNNRVGIGTDNPAQPLHVFGDDNGLTYALVKNGVVGTNAAAVVRTAANVAAMNFQSHSTGRALPRFGVALGGWNEFLAVAGNGLAIGTQGTKPFILGTGSLRRMTIAGNGNIAFGNLASPTHPIQHANGAFLSAAGAWTNASSREFKKDIRELSVDDAVRALADLTPVQFRYKADPGDEYLGFIAEDVPELVASKDRTGLSPMDIVALLTKVVQSQERELSLQRQASQQQEQLINDLMQRIDALTE